jgi:hypothetical protein
MNAEPASADFTAADETRERKIRRAITRSALIWTPLFLVCAGALIFFFIDRLLGGDNGGTWFLVVVLSLFSALTGSQSFQAIADLAGSPHTHVGQVRRRWSKLDSFVMRTHYVRIDTAILRGDVALLDGIETGQRVTARYYKHSGILIAIRKAEAEPVAAGAPGSGPARPEPARPLAAGDLEVPKENKVEF